MKKGQTESYSFLIGIILTVLILTGVGCAAYQLYRPKGKESFDSLADVLRDLEEKGTDAYGDVPIYVEEDEAIIGFNKGIKIVEKPTFEWRKSCYEITFNTKWWTYFLGWEKGIERPEQCPEDKSCLCTCKLSQTIPKLNPLNLRSGDLYIDPKACKSPNVKCKTFATLDLMGGKGCPYGVFIPGKKGRKDKEIRGLATVYYKKEGSIVSIDDEEPEIMEEELKEAITSNYLKDLINKLKDCSKLTDKSCNCNELNTQGIPKDYKIKIEPGKNKFKFSLYKQETKIDTQELSNIKLGLLCYQGDEESKKEFDRDCKAIDLTSEEITLGECCDDTREWGNAKKLYIIKEESGIYLSTREKYHACKIIEEEQKQISPEYISQGAVEQVPGQ